MTIKEWPIKDKIKKLVHEDNKNRYGEHFASIEAKILSHIERDCRASFEAFLRRLLLQVKYAIREGAKL